MLRFPFTKRFFVCLTAALALSGCQGLFLWPSPGFLSADSTASIFYLDAPASAAANRPFIVKAWVALDRSPTNTERLKPETFVATVVPAASQITISGKTEVTRPSPGQTVPATYVAPAAETVDVTVTAGPGTYHLLCANFPSKLPTDLYYAGQLWAPGGLVIKDVPKPAPGRTVVIQ